jgi:assimilatory nitrate reductase catalytic subunit
MTRTGLSPKLSQHRREPWIEIHPEDCRAVTASSNYHAIARVSDALGEKASIARMVTESQREGRVVRANTLDRPALLGRTHRQAAGPDGRPCLRPARVQEHPRHASRPMRRTGAALSSAPGNGQTLRRTATGRGYAASMAGWSSLQGMALIDVEALLPAGPADRGAGRQARHASGLRCATRQAF